MARKPWNVFVPALKTGMASKFILRKKAEEDLTAIIDYIARDNPSAALKLYETFLAQFEYLAQFPQSGRLRTEFRPVVRSLAIGKYIAFFCEADPVEIVRVLHGARSFPEDIESL